MSDEAEVLERAARGSNRRAAARPRCSPGDPQHSYRSLLKAGFRETYARGNYAPPRS